MADVPRDRYGVYHLQIRVLEDSVRHLPGHAKIASGFYRDGMTIGEFVEACEEAGLGHRMKPAIFAKRCLRRDQRAGVIVIDGLFPNGCASRPRPWVEALEKVQPLASPACPLQGELSE